MDHTAVLLSLQQRPYIPNNFGSPKLPCISYCRKPEINLSQAVSITKSQQNLPCCSVLTGSQALSVFFNKTNI